VNFSLSLRSMLLAVCLFPSQACLAQAIPGEAYQLRAIEGDNDAGEYFAFTKIANNFNGFFYLADQGRLIGSTCYDQVCPGSKSLTSAGADRGRYVSAANRSSLSDRPLVAYYDATNGDLMALDCAFADCATFGGIERTLDSAGNVGQDTAIVIDPATGFGLISYYDVDNGDLRLYRCTSADCSTGSSIQVSGTNDRGHNSSLVFGGSTLWIAYEDRTTGEVVIATSQSPYNVFPTFTTISSAAEPSLTVDANGFPDMVWREKTTNTLQRRRCLDAGCSSNSQIQLGGAGQGFRPSATRSAAGNLLVSQFDPANNSLRGTLCTDLACTTPQALLFDTGAGVAGKSFMTVTSNGYPLVYYQESLRKDVRSVLCQGGNCTNLLKRTAINGHFVNGARLAMRPDGRPVVAYIRDNEPRLAMCSNTSCSSTSQVTLPGYNSLTRPAVEVRSDNRPVIYYSSLGGSELYDCADANCTSGSPRTVSGDGNFTSSVLEMALRADDRPVLLYTVSNLNDIYVFDCANANCTSGTSRLLVDEPTADGAYSTGHAIIVGPGNRPIIMYTLNSNLGSLKRYVRCNDSACLSVNSSSVGTNSSLFATPLALRSDSRPVFIESQPDNKLAVCNDADCASQSRVPIGILGIPRTLRLLSGDRPVYDHGTAMAAYVTLCDAPTCTSPEQLLLLSNSESNTGYLGSLGLNAAGSAFVALEESAFGDVLLAVPSPQLIFKNGFEN